MIQNIFSYFLHILILDRGYVLNKSNGKIHARACKWIDNMSDTQRITENEAKRLLKNSSKYKIAICCRDSIKV